jgi:signal peptidase I
MSGPNNGLLSYSSPCGFVQPADRRWGSKMKLIHTNEGTHYRRWINLIPSLLFPGSGQFLSGRKATGIVLFVLYLTLVVAMVAFLVHPKTVYSVVDMGPFNWFLVPFWLLIAGDSLRRPIPRLGFRGWGLFVAVCLGIPILLALGVRTFLVQPFKVPTGAMQPTIMGNRKAADGTQILGDHILVNKLAYRLTKPQRGDVVVFRTKGLPGVKQDTCYVKRLAGLPGETLGIDPPYLLVNDKRVTTPAIFRKIAEGKDGLSGFCPATAMPAFPAPLASPSARLTLGSDEYLVLGDNTRNSLDGRYFGPVKRSAIVGKVFYIYAPAGRKQRIE